MKERRTMWWKVQVAIKMLAVAMYVAFVYAPLYAVVRTIKAMDKSLRRIG